MDASSVSSSSMHTEGLKLLGNVRQLYKQVRAINQHKDNEIIPNTGRYCTRPPKLKLHELERTIHLVMHRLAFLELVTKGLAYETMHDARAYAKFVDSKRKLEDLDVEELRALLR